MGTVGAISRIGTAAPASAAPDVIRFDDPLLVPSGVCPGSIANIGIEDGQNHFLIQTAQDLAAAFEQHSQIELANGFDLPPYVTTSTDKTAVQSRVSVGAPTTGGSTYPRTEYRELGLDGLPIGFDALTGNHWLSFDFRILNTPTNGRDIVVGQLHDGNSDRIAIRAQDVTGTRRGRGRVNGTSVYEFANPLVVGTWYRAKMEVTNGGTVNIYTAADGAAFPATPQYTQANALVSTGSASWYFKYGCYLQTNVANGDVATDYGLVEHRNISHWHTGWPTPAKYYAVPQHTQSHAAGGQDDLSGLYVPQLGPIAVKTANYTLADTDTVVSFDTTAAALIATLPSAVGRAGRRFVIRKLVAANTLRISPAGTETISGAPSVLLIGQGAVRELISDGAVWHVIGAVPDPHPEANPNHVLSRWGLLAANALPSANPLSTTYGPAAWALTRMFVPAGVAITSVCAALRVVGAGAAGTGQNGFAVYEVSGSTATLAASTPTDVTLWTTTGWRKKALSAVVAAQSVDREVMVGMAVSIATTAPTFYGAGQGPWGTRADTGAALYTGTYTGSALTSWAATVNLATAGVDNVLPFLGLL